MSCSRAWRRIAQDALGQKLLFGNAPGAKDWSGVGIGIETILSQIPRKNLDAARSDRIRKLLAKAKELRTAEPKFGSYDKEDLDEVKDKASEAADPAKDALMDAVGVDGSSEPTMLMLQAIIGLVLAAKKLREDLAEDKAEDKEEEKKKK